MTETPPPVVYEPAVPTSGFLATEAGPFPFIAFDTVERPHLRGAIRAHHTAVLRARALGDDDLRGDVGWRWVWSPGTTNLLLFLCLGEPAFRRVTIPAAFPIPDALPLVDRIAEVDCLALLEEPPSERTYWREAAHVVVTGLDDNFLGELLARVPVMRRTA